MENNTLSLSSQPNAGKTAKTVLRILTAYPIFWTVGILVGGLLKSHAFIMFIMATWVVAFYIGTLTWLGLAIYLSVKKKITAFEILIHFLGVVFGILVGHYVTVWNVFDNGVMYID